MATATLNGVAPLAMTSSSLQNETSVRSIPSFAPSPIMIPNKKNICQKEHLKLNMNSPNRNGCYDFDRVIKSGELLKRTRKTKAWKTVHLVLRPNMLSIYKDQEYTKLRHQVRLYDITAIARQRDPKDRVRHVFGLFSPSRNFHLSAQSEAEAQSWVEHIRREARIDEADEEMILMSPTATRELAAPFGIRDHAGTASSSEEPDSAVSAQRHRGQGHARKRSATVVDNHQMHSARRPSSTLQSVSGNEAGWYSDFSDPGMLGSVTSLNAVPAITTTSNGNNPAQPSSGQQAGIYGTPPPKRPTPKRNASHMSTAAGTGAGAGASPTDDRVVYQGHLHLLKSHHGVRQWRTVWAVLRRKTFAVYKNEDEYSAQLVVSFEQLVDAVEVDPLSKTKRECFQLIAEERTYRFCALSEKELDRWLGAFKSLLAKRREGQIKVDGAPVTGVAALSIGPALQSHGGGAAAVTAALPAVGEPSQSSGPAGSQR